MIDLKIPNEFPVMLDGELTMAGVVAKHWECLAKRWNEETKRTYLKEYIQLILPHFSDYPLAYYDVIDYFDDAIESIRKNGTRRSQNSDEIQEYSDATLRHLRYLMRRVSAVADEMGVCPDALWGTEYVDIEMADQEKVFERERTGIPKSASPEFELELAERILTDPLQEGQYCGLLNMFAFGTRNKEAAALTFGSIKEIPGHPGKYVVAIYMSTIGDTPATAVGGKTENMFRYAEVPKHFYDFYMKRKAYIEKEVNAGRIDIGALTIDQLPLACNGRDWTVHCTSNRITLTGKCVFRDIGISEAQVRYLMSEAEMSGELAVWGDEKDPTAYMLRRNYATHAADVGYTIVEIEYSVGHKISDGRFKRSDFVNPDVLALLYDKMARRPIVSDICFDPEMIEINENIAMRDVPHVLAKAPCNGQRLRIVLRKNENHDQGAVKISIEEGSGTIVGTSKQSIVPCRTRNEVNVLYDYWKSYARAIEKRQERANAPRNSTSF